MAGVMTHDGLERLFASMEQTSQALTSTSEPEDRKALLITLKQQIDRADQLLRQEIDSPRPSLAAKDLT